MLYDSYFIELQDLQQTCTVQNKNCSNGCEKGNGFSPCKLVKKVQEEEITLNILSKTILSSQTLNIKLQDSNWFRVTTKKEIFDIWNHFGNESYVLAAGNTAQGNVFVLFSIKIFLNEK